MKGKKKNRMRERQAFFNISVIILSLIVYGCTQGPSDTADLTPTETPETDSKVETPSETATSQPTLKPEDIAGLGSDEVIIDCPDCDEDQLTLWLLINNAGSGKSVQHGDVCKVMDKGTSNEGIEKFKVQCGPNIGWISADYVTSP